MNLLTTTRGTRSILLFCMLHSSLSTLVRGFVSSPLTPPRTSSTTATAAFYVIMPRTTRQSARSLAIQALSTSVKDAELSKPTLSIPRRQRSSSALSETKRAKVDLANTSGVSSSETESTVSSSTTASSSSPSSPSFLDTNIKAYYLPRTREMSILANKTTTFTHVIGIDEAGRGPLAGPVVAAAAYAPTNIAGIVDSKKIAKEDERERLYDEIVASHQVEWAVAVVSAARIDEINILQATLEAMTMAAMALVTDAPAENKRDSASIEHDGCYVVRSSGSVKELNAPAASITLPVETTFALIDGNKLPRNMSMAAEAIVKGDSKEYCIAVASVLAKVTRDRLMNDYAKLYPLYNLQQHKGYPTKAHKQAIAKHGAIPIHRRTFAPLKDMDFD